MACLVVDDEKLARELIAEYVTKHPELELAGLCANALEAQAALHAHSVDLMFLDIHMPDLTGLEFLESLTDPPMTIFTTAYSEYAVKSYELNVVDYLVKPIVFNRFFKAVNKALAQWPGTPSPSLPASEDSVPSTDSTQKEDFFFVKSDQRIIRLTFEEVLYIEAMREYIRIHTPSQRVVTRMSMSRLEELLPHGTFIRIHRTFIVNLAKIDNIEGNMVRIAGKDLPVSKGKKEELLRRVGGWF